MSVPKDDRQESRQVEDVAAIERSGCDFPVVGIGASAGGLEALEAFFGEAPIDSGMAYVVVQHLSPEFKSHMEQLLGRQTQLPIFRVEDGMEVKPNCIYLIPPKKEMIISGGRLLLTEKDPQRSLSHPIDQFFRSLAHDVGRHGIGIVLSGTGSDGSRGIREIHEVGGLVLSQDERTAKFDGMPLNAQSTGVVDVVLPPEAMPAALMKYVHEGLSAESLADQQLLAATAHGIERVFQLLRQEHGIDFSHYKASTVGRRVSRRMDLHRYESLNDYIERLNEDRLELNELYKDLLIGVTRFFRDAEAFEHLEKDVIPEILANAKKTGVIRVWAAGCATGEEAYSIAMLFCEQFGGQRIDFKMFATDVHRTSLQIAAQGIYPKDALSEVSEERQRRFFRKVEDGYQVTRELRQLVVFAPHNVISDAPFTQLDLVTCRNLLIYLQPPAQKKALSLFHFGLKTGGCLFLGPSETPGEIIDEFQIVDKRWRIYRKRRDVRLPAETRLPLAAAGAPTRPVSAPPPSRGRNVDTTLLSTYDRLLDKYMPASFLVDENSNLLHTFGGAERYLQVRGGRASSNLADLVVDELKAVYSGALQHCIQENAVVRYAGIRIKTADDQQETLRMVVEPIVEPRTKVVNYLVQLEQIDRVPVTTDIDDEVDMDEMTREHLQSLESELQFTRENLQATIEELETANEELQATNEELVASNEELQSTNEELHSVNEELYTVNAEHQQKIEELTQANDNMDNLLATTKVGVIFLDRELRIRRFTPEIGRLFHLLPHDVGRSIKSFAHNLAHPGLVGDLKQALDEDEQIETEVEDHRGEPYFMRIMPYRSSNQTQGIVMTLISVKSLKEAQTDLSLFKYMSDYAADPHVLFTEDGRFRYVNRATCAELGYAAEELVDRNIFDIDPDLGAERFSDLFEKANREGAVRFDAVFKRRNGSTYPVQVSASNVKFSTETFLFATARDVSRQKEAERRLKTEHLVTQAIAEETEFQPALQRILVELLAALEVDVAEYWTVEDGDLSLEMQLLARDYEAASEWRQAKDDEGSSYSVGFFRKVFRRRAPDWVDVAVEPDDFPCKREMIQAGIRSGFAFPIVSGGATIGVLGCLSREEMKPDAGLRSTFRTLGHEIGEFAKRLRNDEELRLRDRAISAATDGIVISDAQRDDCPVIYVNEGFVRLTGFESAEIVGRNCRLLQGEGTEAEKVGLIRRAVEAKKECRVTILNYRKDGTPFWNDLRISPVRTAGGAVTHFVGVLHDVSRLKRIEDRLRKAERAAQAANEAKSEFLAHMSHELRTPLSAILGFADVLLDQSSDRRALGHLQTIKRNGKYLLELLNDILDLSKIEAGQLDLEMERFSLVEFVADIEKLISIRAAEKSLHLETVFQTKIPASVATDARRLRQILVNLLGNAVKFTDSGEVKLVVLYEPGESTIEFQVIDTGIGMTLKEQKQLFQPFTQGKSSVRRRYGGTGLGLSISRRLAESLGGSISVSSEKGKGSTFVLRLPVDLGSDRALVDPQTLPPPDFAAALADGRGQLPAIEGRILVADDLPEIWRVAKHFLERAGAEVLVAENGEEAVEKVVGAESAGRPVRAVIMDMQMPVKTGYEAVKELRAKGFDGQIVALTASAMKGEREACLEVGCDEYLAKPIDGQALVELVHGYLRPKAGESGGSRSRRVLIVDDNRDAATSTSLLLGHSGHETEVAHTGEHAIALAQSFQPDVVLLDIGLPDQDGYAVVQTLRNFDELQGVVFVALTGYNTDADVRRSLDAGFDHHLTKPVDWTRLQEVVESNGQADPGD